MGMHYSIRGYGEQQVIAALDYRRHQRCALAQVIATLYVAEVYAD